MSRINTNIQAMVAARVLAFNNDGMSRSLNRLSTGYRINTGRDDPAGLIASETMRAEKKAISAAIDNARAADKMLGVTEAALGEISNILNEAKGIASSQIGVGSDAETRDNQAKIIDAMLSEIAKLANSQFQDVYLFGGNATAREPIVGLDAGYRVFGLRMPASGE